jgi:Xaa-Pro aminopeptidase
MARAAEETERAGLSALLISPSADLLYLCGYDPPLLPRLTCLVLRPGAGPVLLVPALERPRAMDSPAGADLEIAAWPDGDDPYDHVAKLVDDGGAYGVADRMWAVHVLGLQRVLSGAEFVPASRIMAGLRAIKDENELGLLSRAARGADAAFHTVLGRRIEGLREEEVAATLADLLREGGHEIVTFTIVASGPNGASPHHEPGGRPIRDGDPVVLDFGGKVGGYCSDISRTVCVGRSRERFVEVYEIVREAQEAAFQTIRPGLPAEEVDRAARDVIERAGYGERFLHRTGHGIGLEEHENPYIVRGNAEPLQPGMCFSIEPGIYLEGEFGVRIEDIVTVTDDGASRLNRATRELETVA